MVLGLGFLGKLLFFWRRTRGPQQQPPQHPYRVLAENGRYGVYRLDRGSDDGVTVDIVFLHGLQDGAESGYEAWRHTWTTNTGVFWPAEWLPTEKGFDKARIISVCYAANRQKIQGAEDFEFDGAAGGLLRMLISSNVAVGWEGRKVVLVGHSMGGLMINALVHSAANLRDSAVEMEGDKRRAGAFKENLCGLVYYATPHNGAPIAALHRSRLAAILERFIGGVDHSLLRYLEVFSKATGSHKTRFFGALHNRPHLLCFAEQEAMPLPRFVGGPQVIVPQESAFLNPCIGVPVAADHVNIVKPTSREQVAYQRLVEYIREQVGIQAGQGNVAEEDNLL